MTFNENDFSLNDNEKKSQAVVNTLKDSTDGNEFEDTNPEERHQYPDQQRRVPVQYGIDEFVDAAIAEPEIEVQEIINDALRNKEWNEAADSEYDLLMSSSTWELVDIPTGRKPIDYKWIFKVKKGSDGSVQRYKARLVAKGFAQKYGVDYDETFAPVVRYSSIRTLLAFAIQNDMLIHQMDAVTAFLNGTLEEEIYMKQPPGYVQKGKEHLVCKLNKSLYGLKQSPRCWNKAFREYMDSINSTQSTADPCIFIKTGDTRDITIVAVYVDDLTIVTKTTEKMAEIKSDLMLKFKMNDLGKLHHCLGMTIEHDEKRKCLWLHQKPYIMSMLQKFGLKEAKTVSTPAKLSVKLRKDETRKLTDTALYQSIVGQVYFIQPLQHGPIYHKHWEQCQNIVNAPVKHI